jgi:hypothetical protein
MSRTIREELLVPFGTLELDDIGAPAWEAALKVFEKLQRRKGQSDLGYDYEFVLSNGVVNISRFHWFSVSKELSKSALENCPRKLEIEKKGLLQTLRWVRRPCDDIDSEEVEVDVRAVGMNFKVSQ